MSGEAARSRVLLADDDADLREGWSALLRAGGHHVRTAENGVEALALLEAQPFDLVLSDIEMPGMDGLALLARCRELDPALPFVLVTGNATVKAAIFALQQGATDFVEKPVHPTRLRHVVERALELARLAGENRALAEQLEAERLKSEFVAVASHEIRTPLAGIKNCLGILRSGAAGPLTPAQERFLLLAAESLDRLRRLADDLLDAARLEEGRLALRPETFELPALVEEAAAELAPLFAGQGVAVRTVAPPGGVRVRADRERIRQVLLNLLNNAARFSTPGGTVTVESCAGPAADLPPFAREALGAAGGVWAEVRVADEGIGIPPGQEERIFERFVQAEGSLERSHGGAGLGLAIARGIMQCHGGGLWARRREGRGSVFHAVLPSGPGEPSEGGRDVV